MNEEPRSPEETQQYVAEGVTPRAPIQSPAEDADTTLDATLTTRQGAGGVPARVGDYLILEEIARGGMGVVYKARHQTLGRIVALKQIRAGELAHADDLRRFQAEGQAAAQLDHAGIVSIYDVGEDAGQPFMAMAFVDGPSLWQAVKERPLEQREATRIMQRVAEAVEYAHRQGVVHRDLKPQNILMAADGQPKITDFGLAKQRNDDSHLTQTGQILGTPSYMPPEQAAGNTSGVGPLADVYSLGATLYCLITGRPPFQSASPIETLKQVLEQEPVSPRTLNPSITKDLETICLKCLQKAPPRRYASAGELAADLGRFLAGEAITARATGALERAWRWCRRKPLAAGLIFSTAAMLLLLLSGLWYRGEFLATAQRLESAERLKRVSDYHRAMGQVRESVGTAAPGWTWEAEKLLREVRKSTPTEEDRTAWETTYAEVLLHHDLRHLRTVGTGVNAGAIAYSPDGKQVAVGMVKHAVEYSVRVYSVDDGELTNTHTASSFGASLQKLLKFDDRYQDGFVTLAWSPDGHWLVGGSRFGNLVRWDTRQRQAAGIVWKGHEEGLRRIGFLPDGKQLVTAAETWKTWSAAPDWRQLRTAPGPTTELAISPDGQRMAIALIEPTRLELIDPGVEDTVTVLAETDCPAFSPDGRFLATRSAENGNWIDLRQSETGTIARRWRAEQAGEPIPLKELAFAAQGALLLGLDHQGRVHFWNVATGLEAMPMLVSNDGSAVLAAHPTAPTLAFSSTTAATATDLFQVRSPAALATLLQPGVVRGFDSSVDGMKWSVASDADQRSAGLSQRWIQRVDWELPSRRPEHHQKAVYIRVWSPSGAAVLARHPTQERVAWFTEWLGLMVSGTTPQGERDRLVPYPLLGAPQEVDVAEFVQTPAAHGAHLTDTSHEGRVATLPGGPVTEPGQLAIPFAKIPMVGNSPAVNLAVQVRLAGPSSAQFEAGWFSPDLAADDNRMEQVPSRRLGTGPSDWHQIMVAPRTIATEIPGGLACLRQVAGPVPSPQLQLHRCVAFPFARFQPDNKGPESPSFGDAAWSPDGQRLWGLLEARRRLVAWDAETLAVTATWDGSLDAVVAGLSSVQGLAVGDRHVLCASDNGMIRVFPATSRGALTVASVLHVPDEEFLQAVLSRDESWTILSTLTGRVEIRDTTRLELRTSVGGHNLPVRAVQLADSDRLLVTGCDDGWIRLFRVEAGQRVQPWIKLHLRAGPVDRLRLSRDGRYLAAATRGATSIFVWDLVELTQTMAASEEILTQ